MLAQWVHNAEKIRKKNERLNAECVKVAEDFRKDGFDSCVLKGQSNLVNYVSSEFQEDSHSTLRDPQDRRNSGQAPFSEVSGIAKKQETEKRETVCLALYRTPGDIDIWVRPRSVSGHPVTDVVEYVKRVRREHGLTDEEEIRYHHIDMCGVYDCEVEVHFRPQFLDVPWRNRRFQRWCEEQQGVCAVRYCPPGSRRARTVTEGDSMVFTPPSVPPLSGDRNPGYERFACTGFQPEQSFPIPTNSFNAVYQLVHMQRHLMDEGIGLRQLLDYYFVLRALHIEQKSLSQASIPAFPHRERASCGEPPIPRREGEKPDHWSSMGMWCESIGRGVMSNVEIMHQLKRFGLGKFASAVMYVLKTAFAMPDSYLLCEPNEKEGKWLLNEIMLAGNFGQHDERIKHGGGQLSHAWEKTKHNMRLLTHYPEEVMWEPVFRIYHWLWRRFEWWK